MQTRRSVVLLDIQESSMTQAESGNMTPGLCKQAVLHPMMRVSSLRVPRSSLHTETGNQVTSWHFSSEPRPAVAATLDSCRLTSPVCQLILRSSRHTCMVWADSSALSVLVLDACHVCCGLHFKVCTEVCWAVDLWCAPARQCLFNHL